MDLGTSSTSQPTIRAVAAQQPTTQPQHPLRRAQPTTQLQQQQQQQPPTTQLHAQPRSTQAPVPRPFSDADMGDQAQSAGSINQGSLVFPHQLLLSRPIMILRSAPNEALIPGRATPGGWSRADIDANPRNLYATVWDLHQWRYVQLYPRYRQMPALIIWNRVHELAQADGVRVSVGQCVNELDGL